MEDDARRRRVMGNPTLSRGCDLGAFALMKPPARNVARTAWCSAEGDAAGGDVAEGDVAEGDVAEGDVAEADVADADVAERWGGRS
ncbi:hypothetical protein [Burkholderia sp. WSM2230]|uniref:hypothetical protein n=1 Tax=Burkholderia sp. WSM2230 TaxID=944435 RepID=UPI000417FB2E|nr:hypothetical protein [Burkholderia sp. WSM2230]